VKLKALALVFVVFLAAFATCFAIVVRNSRGEKARSVESPSLVLVDNQTIITPDRPIDTPGGPT